MILCLNRAMPEETLVEARSDIDVCLCLCLSVFPYLFGFFFSYYLFCLHTVFFYILTFSIFSNFFV